MIVKNRSTDRKAKKLQQYSETSLETAFVSMCHDPRRYQKMMEEKQKPKEKDLSEWEQFSMRIEQEERGIDIILHCKDPCDLVFLAGWLISGFKKLDVEPKVKVLP